MKVLILYATLTGMTGEIANNLTDRLKHELPDHNFDLANVANFPILELNNYDIVIFGASTWDHGIPPPDGEAFLNQLIDQKPDLSQVKFALFGLGDSIYPAFCGALPLIRADLESCQAKVNPVEYKMDGYPDKNEVDKLINWAKSILNEN